MSKSKGEQGRRLRRTSKAILFPLQETWPRTHTTTLARCSAFGSGGAVSSSDDLWCENSISAPLFYSRTLFLSSFFLRRRGSLPRCKEAGGGGGIEERQTDRETEHRGRRHRRRRLQLQVSYVLWPIFNQWTGEREGETGGQQLKSKRRHSFTLQSGLARRKNELVVGRF